MNHGLPALLEYGGDGYATFQNDPIFTPLFVSLGFTGVIAGTSITTASIASAIATTSLTYGVQIR